jgi:hypothetical protein
MRYCEDIGQPGDYVEHKYHRPRLCRCPQCGTKGRRIKVIARWIPHVGLHQQPCRAQQPGLPYDAENPIQKTPNAYHPDGFRIGPVCTDAQPPVVSDVYSAENRGPAHQHRTDGIHEQSCIALITSEQCQKSRSFQVIMK